ncbi:MAG: hypothetical protein GY696_30595 [Gammaproteobacteria bacterium]|nr:hypothetical protein [Gammaproteobacteria bacterium]
MKRALIWFVMLAMLPLVVTAGRYRQPAYITNFYFSDSLVPSGTFIQPGNVFNALRANSPSVSAYVVLNLVADVGLHQLEVEILDSRGKHFDSLQFKKISATDNDWGYTVTGHFGGSLPEGGIFFKVFDRYNDEEKMVIGTFRLITFK